MTAAAETSTKDETKPEDVEETAADDQGDDTPDTDESEVDWEAKAKELEAAIEAQKRINRNLERRTKRDKARLDELESKPATDTKAASKAETEVDVDKIREEAKAEAARAVLEERVHDKIEVKAKDFADPADAVAMLMRDHKVDDFIDNGKPDVDAIQDALKGLLEKKPYLAASAQGGKQQRFQGSAEGGAKPSKPSRPKSLDEAVRRRLTPQ